MLTGGEAEVKLNGLDLSGPNKRVELDDRSKLSVVLMETPRAPWSPIMAAPMRSGRSRVRAV